MKKADFENYLLDTFERAYYDNIDSLDKVYGRYSSAKENAFNYHRDRLNLFEHDHTKLYIMSHTGWIFTLGVQFYKQDNKTGELIPYLMYITPVREYVMRVPEARCLI